MGTHPMTEEAPNVERRDWTTRSRLAYQATKIDSKRRKELFATLWQGGADQAMRSSELVRWYYDENPFETASFLLEKTEPDGTQAPVGTSGIAERPMMMEGHAARAGLCGEALIDRAHRSLFPTLTLSRTARDWGRKRFELLYAFPSKGALAILTRLGFQQLGGMVRYVRTLRTRPVINTVTRLRPVAWLLALLGDFWLALCSPAAWGRLPKEAHLEWMSTFDVRFDVLWKEARAAFSMVSDRQARLLTWRFRGQPNAHCEIVALTEREGGALRAYAVLQTEGSTACVRDLFGTSAAEMGLLVRALLPALRRKGFARVAFALLGSPALIKALRALGFRGQRTEEAVVWSRGESCPVSQSFLGNPDNWHLTEADRDP